MPDQYPTPAELRSKMSLVAGWFKYPNARNHPYNDTQREQKQWGDAARSPAIQALMDASIIAEYLESIIPDLVGMARSEGDTWQEIGETLGISKQAAQQRFREVS